jgi:hypothetical protein
VTCDRLRYQAGHDEVTGVIAADVRTSRAASLASVAARCQDETLVAGVVGDLAGDGVDEVLATVRRTGCEQSWA